MKHWLIAGLFSVTLLPPAINGKCSVLYRTAMIIGYDNKMFLQPHYPNRIGFAPDRIPGKSIRPFLLRGWQ